MIQNFSDAFRGSFNNSDIAIDFGRVRKEGGAAENAVDLDARITMSPVTAKRLILQLGEAIQQQETKARFTRKTSSGSAPTQKRPGRGQTPVNAPADPSAERAAVLLRSVGELGVPYQYERSFRVSQERLAANRYLLTLNRRDIPGDSLERVMEICRRIGMPPELYSKVKQEFDAANCVHFGFEGDVDGIIYKLYLERVVPELEAGQARAAFEAVPLHVAFKWDILRKTHVVTRYLWYPSLSAQKIEARLAEVYSSTEPSPSLQIALEVLRLAAAKAPAERLQYLEVREDENARWSFDLNVYDARLNVKDMQPQLQAMRERFAMRPGQFQALYDQIKNRPLGHVAGGVHRNGADFFNIYYGVAGFPQFAERYR